MLYPIIKADNLILRQLEQVYEKDIFALFSDQIVTNPIGIQSMTNTKEANEWILNKIDSVLKGNSIEFCIINKLNEEFVGRCGFNNIDKTHKNAELSCAILPKYWKKGFAKKSILEISKYFFATLNMHRIEARLYPNNLKMKNLLISLGFLYEGTLKENYYFDGIFGDTSIYALINN